MTDGHPLSAAPLTLVLTRTFAAPRALVFAAWTRPEHLVRWWGPNQFTLPTCEQDFRGGGRYRYCMRAPDGGDHWVWGEYREIMAPERLVFTWGRDDEAGLRCQSMMLVEVTLAERGGGTLLTLRQTNFQTVADRDGHQSGWTECLDRLGAYAAEMRDTAAIDQT